jgi:hypothetical protein
MIPNPIKMAIWDLDDTFWHGTLGEGAFTVDQGRAVVRIHPAVPIKSNS